ncbi:MAG: phosphatase PAP2 family protein [Lachnospiraceae bacterium]|nr:phosphatase PAP2 family protein [Lachnospiraceae bacterium]
MSNRIQTKKEKYSKRMEYMAEHPKVALLIHRINRIITYVVFGVYPLLLLWLLSNRDSALADAIIIPLDAFLILTVFRYLVNRKRPYETYGVGPAIPKSTKGKSFPSRHVFSAFMIAMTYLFFFPYSWCGSCLLILGVILAILRVVSGVHHVSDVIVGAVWGILAGVLYFII